MLPAMAATAAQVAELLAYVKSKAAPSWVYPMAPDPVRRSVVASLLAWFCLDSAGSIVSGNPSNAGFNVVVLLLAVGPLWRPARD